MLLGAGGTLASYGYVVASIGIVRETLPVVCWRACPYCLAIATHARSTSVPNIVEGRLLAQNFISTMKSIWSDAETFRVVVAP